MNKPWIDRAGPKIAEECRMITLYHRTTEDIARLIVVDGFRDGEGYYGTEYLHSGVWLSDGPLEANDGALGNALLRVELSVGDQEISPFEWIEDGKGYREWLISCPLDQRIRKQSSGGARELASENPQHSTVLPHAPC